jgi:hypothetical protein
MDKFLDTYDHAKLNQEDINHLNRSIIHNEIDSGAKSLQKKNNPGPERFSAEFHQIIKEELIATFLKLLHEIEREGTLRNSFYEASIGKDFLNTTLAAHQLRERMDKWNYMKLKSFCTIK